MEEEISVKKRYGILALFILIAIGVRIWEFFKQAPPAAALPTHAISAVLGLLLIPLIYKLTKIASDSTYAGLFAAGLAINVPLYGWGVSGQLALTLALGFFFFTLLCLLSIKKISDWKPIIAVPLIFAFIHVYSLLLIPIFALYILLSTLEEKELSKNEVIFILISSLFIFSIFLFFTAAPTNFSIIQKYVQAHYYAVAAEHLTLQKAFALAGYLPIYLGMIGSYFGVKEKRKSVLLLLSTMGILFGAMSAGLVAITRGLPFLILSLCALAGFALKEAQKKIAISKFKKYENLLTAAIFAAALIIGFLFFL